MSNQGNYGGDRIPKFFKSYLPDEAGDDMELPISFNKWLPNLLPKSVTVRSIYGNIWKLVLKKCIGDTVKFVLVNGWKRIVKDEVLEGGEFLEFEFDGFSRFNFCIYGYATCKRLRSSEQPIEIEDQYDGEDDKSSDGFIVLDEDDADDDDINVEECIEVLDDDDDDTNEVQKYVEEDTISLTDDDENESVDAAEDDNDEDEDEDDEDEDFDAADDERQHLDNRKNSYFLATMDSKNRHQLVIPARVIYDYSLNFKESVILVDPISENFGTVERKIRTYIDGKMVVTDFGSIVRRNEVQTRDKLVCEIKKRGRNNLVHTIKIHVLRG